MKARIMYIERKGDDVTGPGRIGRVTFSKTGSTLYYDGKSFKSLKGGYKANYFEVESGENYWISGCKKRGGVRMYGSELPVEIDEDVRDEYWNKIRNWPSRTIRDRV
jgi:hypothetical protein